MHALARLFDAQPGIVPVNLGTAANTGNRFHMRHFGGVTVFAILANGVAAEAPVLTLQEHNAASAGTSQDLAAITAFHQKSAATLAGTESWVTTEQAAAATVTDATWDDANEVLAAFEVDAPALSDGFEYLSVNIADTGTGPHLGAVLYVPYEPRIQRAVANMAALL